jgi:ATP-dependent Lon protease
MRPQALPKASAPPSRNLYARSRELMDDRDPRSHEFTVQLHAFDAAKSGNQLSVEVAIALCMGLLGPGTELGVLRSRAVGKTRATATR